MRMLCFSFKKNCILYFLQLIKQAYNCAPIFLQSISMCYNSINHSSVFCDINFKRRNCNFLKNKFNDLAKSLQKCCLNSVLL